MREVVLELLLIVRRLRGIIIQLLMTELMHLQMFCVLLVLRKVIGLLLLIGIHIGITKTCFAALMMSAVLYTINVRLYRFY
jgi:hypothetical protein